MQSERQNNHIQQAVDGLQQVPDRFVFNSGETWSGLEQRLPGKKKKKTWYYAAAAILLVAGTVYLGFLSNKSKLIVNGGAIASAALQPEKKFAKPAFNQKNVHITVSASSLRVSEKHNTPTMAVHAAEVKHKNGLEIVPEAKALTTAEQIVVTNPTIEQASNEIKKIIPAIAATKPAPKKYKVIHLNELLQSAIVADQQNTLSKSELKKMMQYQNDEKEIVTPSENNSKQLFFFKIKPATTTNTISIVEN
jgi:predicted outer membrane repeat protein